MSPEEKIEMGRALIAEAEAEIAAKKRNWPEKIEPGMVFSEPNGSSNAWFSAGVGFACISGSCLGMWRETLPSGCHYIGKDCISIRIRKDTDNAHEPTGAELVGRAVSISDEFLPYHPSHCGKFHGHVGTNEFYCFQYVAGDIRPYRLTHKNAPNMIFEAREARLAR